MKAGQALPRALNSLLVPLLLIFVFFVVFLLFIPGVLSFFIPSSPVFLPLFVRSFPFLFLYNRKSLEEKEQKPSCQEIYDYITNRRKDMGTSYCFLKNLINIGADNPVQIDLDVLKRLGRIRDEKDGRYRIYYPRMGKKKNLYSPTYKDITTRERDVLIFFAQRKNVSEKSLSNKFSDSDFDVMMYINRLHLKKKMIRKRTNAFGREYFILKENVLPTLEHEGINIFYD